jgi:hypothetical protein
MVTAVRLIGPLVLFVLLVAALAISYQPRPQRHPSKLEKTCPYNGAWLPCFIRDEALQQTWNV